MFANEFLKKHYTRLVFQLSFLYLSTFVFAIFLLPLLLHSIGQIIFLLSGLASILVIWMFVRFLKKFSEEKFKQSWKLIWLSVAVIFGTINLLYFTNLIPPIPLSLQNAGIYHSVIRPTGGNYLVTGEKKSALDFFRLHEEVHLISGEPLYAYSAVFSPTALDPRIVHEWQYKDENTGKWVTASRIPLTLTGGRAEGFRTYSTKSNFTSGLWRVNVATSRGAVIGRISFRIVSTTTRVPLEILVK